FAPFESFDGLVGAPGQKVHSCFRGIVDERLAASRSVQEGNIEAHDAKPDYADFAYFLNHKTGFSRKNSTAPEIPQHSGKLNLISGLLSFLSLTLTPTQRPATTTRKDGNPRKGTAEVICDEATKATNRHCFGIWVRSFDDRLESLRYRCRARQN